MRLADTVLSILFPDSCIGCERKGSLLCAACMASLPPAPPSELPFIMSVHAYSDRRVQRLVGGLKYENATRAARLAAPPMAHALAEYLGEEQHFIQQGTVLLVPIPLSRERRRTRGYNQAELLARGIVLSGKNARDMSVDTSILTKVRNTLPQAKIGRRSARLRNLDGAFAAARASADHQPLIVLVDDVSTTGATLLSARETLRAAGYRHVIALTLAH